MAVADLLSMTSKQTADKQKALDSALAQIERQFGKGSIMKLGGDNPVKDIEATSTGSLGLDIALGVGGYPRGRVVEIYGPESSGKTTLTLHAIAEAQKAGGIAAFIDAEHAFDLWKHFVQERFHFICRNFERHAFLRCSEPIELRQVTGRTR